MSNMPVNDGRKQRPNLISTEDINNNNQADFFDDLNSTLVDDIDHSMEKQEQLKKEEAEKEIEKSKNIRSKLIVVGIILAVLIVLVIVVVVLLNVSNKANYVLNTMESGVIVEQQPVFEVTTNKYLVDLDNTGETTEDGETETYDYNIVSLNDGDTLKSGDTILLDVIVNTKESGEEIFSDHETQLFFTYDNIEIGYDNVIKAVSDYNESSNNKITLPSKEDYDASGMDLVLVEFKVNYPNNFPTYNSDGKVFVIPKLNMSIKGLCAELLVDDNDLTNPLDRYVVIDEFVYDISPMIDITNEIGEEVNKKDELTYRFITSLPYNTTKNLYELKLELEVNNTKTVYNIENCNTTVVEIVEEDISVVEDAVVNLEEQNISN